MKNLMMMLKLMFEMKNGTIETRGKTKLKDIWNLPKGLRIVVQCNDLNQAVGDEAGILSKFLGMVARNGTLCSLSYTDWRFLIGKRERKTKSLDEFLCWYPDEIPLCSSDGRIHIKNN